MNKVTVAEQAYQNLNAVSAEERAKSFIEITERLEQSFKGRSVTEGRVVRSSNHQDVYVQLSDGIVHLTSTGDLTLYIKDKASQNLNHTASDQPATDNPGPAVWAEESGFVEYDEGPAILESIAAVTGLQPPDWDNLSTEHQHTVVLIAASSSEWRSNGQVYTYRVDETFDDMPDFKALFR